MLAGSTLSNIIHSSMGRGSETSERAFDYEAEERKLMQGAKNLENKDDFWISLS